MTWRKLLFSFQNYKAHGILWIKDEIFRRHLTCGHMANDYCYCYWQVCWFMGAPFTVGLTLGSLHLFPQPLPFPEREPR